MFLFTAAVNDTSRRADQVADFYCEPYVSGLRWLSMILKAYNVYPLTHLDGVRLTVLSLVSHSSSWKSVE